MPAPRDGNQLVVTSGNVANASAAATLPGVPGKTTYITGFQCTGLGATGAGAAAVTITGLLGGTQTHQVTVPAGSAVPMAPLVVNFPFPIPASALNTSIVVTMGALGAGNTTAQCSAYGFQM